MTLSTRMPEEFLLEIGKTYIFTAEDWAKPFSLYNQKFELTGEALEQNDIILIVDYWFSRRQYSIADDINYQILLNDVVCIVQNLDLIFVKELK